MMTMGLHPMTSEPQSITALDSVLLFANDGTVGLNAVGTPVFKLKHLLS